MKSKRLVAWIVASTLVFVSMTAALRTFGLGSNLDTLSADEVYTSEDNLEENSDSQADSSTPVMPDGDVNSGDVEEKPDLNSGDRPDEADANPDADDGSSKPGDSTNPGNDDSIDLGDYTSGSADSDESPEPLT
ncbi:MAG: hypothetical protein Q4P72_01520 [Eubacteriales bacterium]|nr:hypothetical protein [Eubacteriales bacterium]